MTAKIIDLAAYRESGVKCAKSGFLFPTIYRRVGVSWEFVPGSSKQEIRPGSDQVILYTLSDQPDQTIANSSFSPIKHLDSAIDHGWIILRHHLTEEAAEGYLDALVDLQSDEEELSQVLFRTPKGIFSIVKRPPLKGRPDHLIAYTTKVQHEQFGWIDATTVINSAAEVVDSDVMSPIYEDPFSDT